MQAESTPGRTALGDLDTRRTRLERHIEDLRSFEREYRTRLRAYLESQLADLGVSGPPEDAGNGVPGRGARGRDRRRRARWRTTRGGGRRAADRADDAGRRGAPVAVEGRAGRGAGVEPLDGRRGHAATTRPRTPARRVRASVAGPGGGRRGRRREPPADAPAAPPRRTPRPLQGEPTERRGRPRRRLR